MKPPRTGNCSLLEAPIQPLISMSKLKEIYKTDKKQSFLEDIKEKLNFVIAQNDNDFTDFTNAVDHDYDLPYIVQCLMYFVTGNICKDFAKFTKCDVCRCEFFDSEGSPFIANHPIAQLNAAYNIQHPNIRLYNFLEVIEQSFIKHCNQSNMYDLVVNEITQNKFQFPCGTHAKDVLAYITHYYLQLRMRQYAKLQIADQKKKLRVKKTLKTVHDLILIKSLRKLQNFRKVV